MPLFRLHTSAMCALYVPALVDPCILGWYMTSCVDYATCCIKRNRNQFTIVLAMRKFLGEALQLDALLVHLHDALQSGLVRGRHLARQVEDVDVFRDRHLAPPQGRQQRRLACATVFIYYRSKTNHKNSHNLLFSWILMFQSRKKYIKGKLQKMPVSQLNCK